MTRYRRRHLRHRVGSGGSWWGHRATRRESARVWARRRDYAPPWEPRARARPPTLTRLAATLGQRYSWLRGRARRAAAPRRSRARAHSHSRRQKWPWSARRLLPPWWTWRPWSPPRVGLRDVVHRRRRDDECGRPGRLRSRPKGSRRQCPVFGRAPATPYSSYRALWRARVPGSSSAPKRFLKSWARISYEHSYVVFHNFSLLPAFHTSRRAAASTSLTVVRSERANWPLASTSPHAVSAHHHAPRPPPRPRYHAPLRSRAARTNSWSLRALRQTTHVRIGVMPRLPSTLTPQVLRRRRSPRHHPRRH